MLALLTTMHNLAFVYSSQGRYAEAEELYNRVLRSREQQLGSEHVRTLNTMHNLALVYWSQGRYAEAEELYNRVLRSREQQLGSDHVDVLNTMNNLALVYSSQGRYAEAEELYNRVLRSREQQLGSEHVSTLNTMHNLAFVYSSQGRYAEAEELYNRVLRSREQQLGSEHVARTHHNALIWLSSTRLRAATQKPRSCTSECCAVGSNSLDPSMFAHSTQCTVWHSSTSLRAVTQKPRSCLTWCCAVGCNSSDRNTPTSLLQSGILLPSPGAMADKANKGTLQKGGTVLGRPIVRGYCFSLHVLDNEPPLLLHISKINQSGSTWLRWTEHRIRPEHAQGARVSVSHSHIHVLCEVDEFEAKWRRYWR